MTRRRGNVIVYQGTGLWNKSRGTEGVLGSGVMVLQVFGYSSTEEAKASCIIVPAIDAPGPHSAVAGLQKDGV